MLVEEDEIRICSGHQEYPTPLIWTFAFNGAEYWCPACGITEGMLGAGELVPWTWKLHHRHLRYLKRSKRFLRAKGVLICARFKYKGQWIEPEKMPNELRNYYIREAKKWRYKFN